MGQGLVFKTKSVVKTYTEGDVADFGLHDLIILFAQNHVLNGEKLAYCRVSGEGQNY